MSTPASPIPRALYRADEVRQLDRIAIEQFGIDGFMLMQRAGQCCLAGLLQRWPDTRRLLVFAGSGNNGGDACIVAGLAREQGLQVELVLLHDPAHCKGDARRAWQWAISRRVMSCPLSAVLESDAATVPCPRTTVIVDGLLGTGLDREVAADYRTAIDWINRSNTPVLAIDIPSGLNADTGMPMAAAVVADLTATFVGLKQGLLTGVAGNHVGQLLFSDLDLPPQVYSAAAAPQPMVRRIDIVDASRQLKPRAPATHKADCGHVVVVGGDFGFGGAALLAAEAALRAGAGLVTVVTRSHHRAALLARRPELMVVGTEDDHDNGTPIATKGDTHRNKRGHPLRCRTEGTHRGDTHRNRGHPLQQGTPIATGDATGDTHAAGDDAREEDSNGTPMEQDGCPLLATLSSGLVPSLIRKASVIVVGPGLGQGAWARTHWQACLAARNDHAIPLVVDADGLNLLAQQEPPIHHDGGGASDNWILTPHPGEAARLLQCNNATINRDRFAAIRTLQQTWGGHCLLKGHGSLLVSPDEAGRVYLCSEGNAGMASGGMGDVLAGLIGGLVAQGLAPGSALRAAVCIHGEAADLASPAGQRGMLATDLLPAIRQLVNPGC